MSIWQYLILAALLFAGGAGFWRLVFRPWPTERRIDRIARRVQGNRGDA